MKQYLSILLLFLYGLSASCQSNQENQPSKHAIQLNNKAIKVAWALGDEKEQLKKANTLLDSAIAIDPDYIIARQNKIANLISLKDFESSIQEIDEVLALRPNYIEMVCFKALVLEFIGQPEEAMRLYEKVASYYKRNYGTKHSFNALENYVISTFLLRNRQEALTILNKEYEKLPEDEQSPKRLQVFREMISSVQRQSFLGVNSPQKIFQNKNQVLDY